MYKVITGNAAAAYAAKLCRVDVVAAYPITPQTTIVEYIAEFLANGEMDCEYIRVESEHSAMTACIGASLAGARTFTATSSHGLALMHEMLHWATYSRLPIVMAVANRTLGPPWNIWADLQDAISQRDTGWIQFYAKNNQEVLDTIIQAYRLSENERVMLPSMVSLEAFVLSHTSEPVDIPDQEKVDEFLPQYNPPFMVIDFENPKTIGNIALPEETAKHRKYIMKAMENASSMIKEISKEFQEKFGRYHGDLLEEYELEDSETVIVSMGTIASTAEDAVNLLREKGEKVGLLRIRVFRPFPERDIKRKLEDKEKIIVIDRNCSWGIGGALYTEVRHSLYPGGPEVVGFLAGIGGVDVTPSDIMKMYEKAKKEKGGSFWYGP